jgi:hypothetical protein
MRCPGCHSENPSDMSFCGKCGASLVNRCPKCCFESPPALDFCGRCGSPLSNSKTSQSERSAAAPAPAFLQSIVPAGGLEVGQSNRPTSLHKRSAQPILGVNQ